VFIIQSKAFLVSKTVLGNNLLEEQIKNIPFHLAEYRSPGDVSGDIPRNFAGYR